MENSTLFLMVLLDARKIPKVSTKPGVAGKNYEPPKRMIEKMLATLSEPEPPKLASANKNDQNKLKTCEQKSEDEKSRLRQYLKMAHASGND